jgi:hypothetical protein
MEGGGDSVNNCDWSGCLQIGLFDGVDSILLNAEGQKHIATEPTRFIYLCPEHFKLGVGASEQTPPEENLK